MEDKWESFSINAPLKCEIHLVKDWQRNRRFWKNEQKKGDILSQINRETHMVVHQQDTFLSHLLFLLLLGGGEEATFSERRWFRTSGRYIVGCMIRFSLGRLLENAGFNDVSVCNPDVSQFPVFFIWVDVIDGEVRKPDSLFMEGVCT
jgi:hypothetical protein